MPNPGLNLESDEQTPRSRLKSYALAIMFVGLIGSLNLLALPYLGYRAAGFIFLVGVLPTAVLNGLGPAVVFAGLSALTWDFFFIPPQFHFAIQTTEDALMNITYFSVAIVTGILGNRLKVQEELLKKRERHVRLLYEFERDLASRHSLESVLLLGGTFLKDRLGLLGIALSGDDNGLVFAGIELSQKEKDEANWVYRNERRAGRWSSIFGNSRLSYFPLSGISSPAGVLVVQLNETNPSLEKQVRRLCPPFGTAIEREKHRELSERNQLLEDSEKLHQTLLNSVSHELRTPLTSMLGSLDHLQNRIPLSDRPFFTELRLAAETLDQTVTNLLDMSRVTSGALQLRRELIDLNDFLHTCITNVAPFAQNHPIELSESVGPIVIRGDEKLLGTAIANVIGNAVRHSPPGSSIQIAIDTDSKFATLKIDDQGTGIHGPDRERVFEKFYSLGAQGGVGLGLAIVRAIVEAHGGRVRLTPHLGTGTGILIELPIENLPESMHREMNL
jgi:two-component system sensor histidine kinase KdpD